MFCIIEFTVKPVLLGNELFWLSRCVFRSSTIPFHVKETSDCLPRLYHYSLV